MTTRAAMPRLERGLGLRRERLVLQTEAGSQAVAERHDDRRLTLHAPTIERGEDEAQRNGSGNCHGFHHFDLFAFLYCRSPCHLSGTLFSPMDRPLKPRQSPAIKLEGSR